VSVRVLLVDDHPHVRDGQRLRLEATPGFEVVADTGSVVEALELAERTPADVALVDIDFGKELGETAGLGLIARLSERCPALKVLVVTMHDKPNFARLARDSGARGYVLKDDPRESLIAAVNAVAAGRTWFSPRLDWSEIAWGKLTPRERQVMWLVGQGFSNDGIGSRLDIEERTVETHRQHGYRKLGVWSALEVLEYVRKNGILESESAPH